MRQSIFGICQAVCFAVGLMGCSGGGDVTAADSQLGNVSEAVTVSGTVGFLGYSYHNPNMTIFMDTENDGNADYLGVVGSSRNLTSVTGMSRTSANHGGMQFSVNTSTLSALPRLEFDYISLLFSDTCPTNGIRFGEIFDNEDDDNQDYASASVDPGWSRRDWTGTRLEFCFVPGTGVHTTTAPPWFQSGSGDPSGAFALPGKEYYWYQDSAFPFTRHSWCSDSQEALLDGEDDGWDGSIDWEGLPEEYKSRVNAIMDIRWGAPHFYINSCPHGIPVGTAPN